MIGDQDRRTAWARIISANPNWVAASLFAVAMIPLLVTPVLPLIDFYNHLARFYVLAHIGADPVLQTYYQAHWSLLPDIGVDVLATPLLHVLPPLIAAKVIVAAILAVLYSGVLYFHRVLTGQKSLLIAVLLLPLLYSYILNWGFANFLLGLGLAFWAAGWWLSQRRRPFLVVPISCIWSLLIYFSHGVTFALYGILLLCLEIGIFINTPARKPRELARSLALLAIQAILPAIFFLSWKIDQAASDRIAALAAQGSPPLLGVIPVAHNGLHRLSTILRVEEGPAYWFDIATTLIQIGAIIFLISRRHVTLVRPAWLLLVIAGLLAVVTPSAMMGTFYISDRLPLFAALCLVGAISIHSRPWDVQSRVAGGLLVATVFIRIAAITLSWHSYSAYYREFRTIAAEIPRETLMLDVGVGSGHHETNVPRCEMYGPLLVSLYGQMFPIFSDKNQQPILLTGALAKARDALRSRAVLPSEMTKDYNPYMSAARASGYQMLLVCNTQLLAHPFSPEFATLAKTPHFALLRAEK